MKKNDALGALFAFVIILPILFANKLREELGLSTTVAVAAFAAVVILALLVSFRKQRNRFLAIKIANIDSMTGIEFERYLQMLLTSQGYKVSMTAVSGDFGVDLVATCGRDRIAIQVKRH